VILHDLFCGQLVNNTAAAATTIAIGTTIDNLAVIKQIAAALNEYITMKDGNTE
jgi:hypothetical protein